MLDQLTKTLSPRLISLLLLAVATLIISTGYSGWFKNPVKEYKQLLTQVENLQRQPLDQQSAEREAQKIRQEITDLNQRLTETGREVLKGTKAIDVISDLGAYAKQHNVQLTDVSPGNKTTGERYTEIPFQVILSGEYQQLFKWVYSLEHSKIPLFIKEFSLQPGATVESRQLLLTIALIQPIQQG